MARSTSASCDHAGARGSTSRGVTATACSSATWLTLTKLGRMRDSFSGNASGRPSSHRNFGVSCRTLAHPSRATLGAPLSACYDLRKRVSLFLRRSLGRHCDRCCRCCLAHRCECPSGRTRGVGAEGSRTPRVQQTHPSSGAGAATDRSAMREGLELTGATADASLGCRAGGIESPHRSQRREQRWTRGAYLRPLVRSRHRPGDVGPGSLDSSRRPSLAGRYSARFEPDAHSLARLAERFCPLGRVDPLPSPLRQDGLATSSL